MILSVVFWFFVLLLLHSYVIYPWLLKLISRGKQQNSLTFAKSDENLPDVYVVFAVYNEQKVIRQKLASIFETDYPLHKIHVFVGSDNSTDDTNSIIQSYSLQHRQLTFHNFEGRNGKAAILNRLLESISEANPAFDSILVLTDANVFFTPNLLFELTKHYKNENIGQVGANILNVGERIDGISKQEKGYIQRENHIKFLEGLNWGAMIGAFGACYTMRMKLWKPIPPNYLMEDFFLSMHILRQKKKAILELNAICYEDVSNDVTEEFKRKTRIQAGNFQNLRNYWSLAFGFNAVGFCFFSHKIIRWFGPLLMAGCYISNLFLLHEPFYQFTFLLQNMLWLSPLLDALLKTAGIHLTFLRFASYFIIMNIALVKGFLMFAKGIKTSAWNPTKRNV